MPEELVPHRPSESRGKTLIWSTPSTHSCWKRAWPLTSVAASAAMAAIRVDFMVMDVTLTLCFGEKRLRYLHDN